MASNIEVCNCARVIQKIEIRKSRRERSGVGIINRAFHQDILPRMTLILYFISINYARKQE